MYKDLSPLYRGDSRTLHLHVVNSTTGADIDITGWKIYFTVKQYKTDSDTDAEIKKDTTTHVDPTHGKSDIVLTSEDTHNLVIGTNYYDIQVKKPDDTVKTFVSGEIDILEDITRRVE